MAKRDRRSRALLRNLRKQARKGQLTAREKKELLDQEARFRKARRANAPYMGAGLLGASALLGTPAGQSILESIAGGVRGLRQDALGAREDRKTFKEQSQQERDLMAAETEQEIRDMMEKAAGGEPAPRSEAEATATTSKSEPAQETPKGDPLEEMTIEEARNFAKEQGFESVQAMKDFYKDFYTEGERDMEEAERERVAQMEDTQRERATQPQSDIDFDVDRRMEAARDMSFRPAARPENMRGYQSGRAAFASVLPELERLREEEGQRKYEEALKQLDRSLAFPTASATEEVLSGSPFAGLGDRPRLTSPNNPISRRVEVLPPRFPGEELGMQEIPSEEEDFQNDTRDFNAVTDLLPSLERSGRFMPAGPSLASAGPRVQAQGGKVGASHLLEYLDGHQGPMSQKEYDEQKNLLHSMYRKGHMELDEYNRELERLNSMGFTKSQAKGGKNPRVQDLMKRIARKYGIK